jgi:predicted NAD/FAD-binding protein
MSFSVRSDEADVEYNGSTVRQLFAQRRNFIRPSFYRMLADVMRFNRAAPEVVRNGAAHVTLGEYVAANGYSKPFVDHYLLPMGSAIWSVPRRKVLEMPAAFFVRFFENHGMLTVNDRPEWRVITGGSRRYVERLTAGFRDRIRLRHPVRQVRRFTDRVEVDGERFDHVVLACHSDQALARLADPTGLEREILGAMPYEANKVVLHLDTSMLPRRRSAWAAWNYRVAGPADQPAAVTYNMNMLQSLTASRTFCVTLNQQQGIDPESVLYEGWYHHPLYTTDAVAAQERHGEISGIDRTHYAGAYWGNGFHEDGVRSALAVGEAFGMAL